MPWGWIVAGVCVVVLLVNHVVVTRRQKVQDRQYDLRFRCLDFENEDGFHSSADIDFLLLRLVIRRGSIGYPDMVRVYDVRRFSADHWESRETEVSWANRIGELRAEKGPSSTVIAMIKEIETGPAWVRFHDERGADIEKQFTAFVDGFNPVGPFGDLTPSVAEPLRQLKESREHYLRKASTSALTSGSVS